MSLSLHARLIIHGTVIWASGQVKIDDKLIHNDDDDDDLSYQKENNILDYSVRVDDGDERIDVVFRNSKQKSKAPLSPSSVEPPVEPISNATRTKENKDDLEDISIPRLAIVILIVGTRGDVQPFIA